MMTYLFAEEKTLACGLEAGQCRADRTVCAYEIDHRVCYNRCRSIVCLLGMLSKPAPRHPPPTKSIASHHRLQVNIVSPCLVSTLRVPVRSFLACLALCLVVAISHQALAQTGALDQSPAEIVKKYFALDQKGAKLDSLSYESLAPYKDWQVEPAWGRVVMIRGFSVAEHYRQWEVVDRLEVVIPVTFEVIGAVYMETAGFVPESSVEEIHVRVKSVRNRWRIVEPVLPPHVGQKRMINFVREAWVKEAEPAKRERLAQLRDELRKAK
jgi:hypothetical protein